MRHLISILFMVLMGFTIQAQPDDPNDFFKNRKWTVQITKNLKILAQSQYLGEPVQRPNLLIAKLKCGKKNAKPFLKKKYCGINYMKMVGGQLEILFLDYSSKNSRGYCTKKRIEKFPIPSC